MSQVKYFAALFGPNFVWVAAVWMYQAMHWNLP